MKTPRRTAIKALAALALTAMASLSLAAQVAGTVINLSGPLMAKKANGTVKVLVVKSEVEQGDTLVSEKNTYAQIKFVDNSEITLKPNTTFKVEAFSYDAGKPEGDSASFNLVKGGLRSITGLMGKRNKEKFQMKTPTATIGIRGTTFTAQWVEPHAGPVPVDAKLAPGLYVAVSDGMINVVNGGGAKLFSVGQFGFVPGLNMAPVMLPSAPDLKFTPPPTFVETKSADKGKQDGVPERVDCEVR